MRVQELGTLGNGEIPILFIMTQTLFSAQLNTLHQQFWLVYYVFVGNVSAFFYFYIFFFSVKAVNVALFWDNGFGANTDTCTDACLKVE